ncbi:helix-turn-helix domain-containing protein [Cardiobacterium valvarum]|uniref:DNA-binding helix-turn-helix protein n=1 Tax=Cardiobacterium valvarum F0432 TaxID=797473 RepID=G9ZFK6_9GAMM|nr:helix-turn-helix transcriptional regulator [Cardiobacterium valvarum]EHM53895.1 DNA-binding helix-turn-helix protein [Cardiobacterium valvarum F0432]
MKVHDKIRTMRELRHWSQEEMAARLSMSTNGYAKLERGETRLNIPKLEQIAGVLDVDLNDLMAISERSVICLFNESGANHNNYYANSSQELTAEINRLQQLLGHQETLGAQKDALIAQQAREIETLRTLVAVLQKNGSA